MAPECMYKTDTELNITIYKFDLVDDITDAYRYFDPVTDIIKKSIELGPVLVHCQKGYSRSPTMVMAYLIKICRKSVLSAYQMITQNRRILPNPRFMHDLMRYEAFLHKTYSFFDAIDEYIIMYITQYLHLPQTSLNHVKYVYDLFENDYVLTIEELRQTLMDNEHNY
jgi:hypothetical protein